jgi:tRNA (adenine57-N1/adenine58-N1)-methyltransferase
MALPHLGRLASRAGPSPLNPMASVYLCSFSPCIEQAQRTVSTLKELGWVDVTVSTLHHARIDVRRERIGLQQEGLRGVNATPANVDEALGRLRELESKTAHFIKRRKKQMEILHSEGNVDEYPKDEPLFKGGPGSKQERLKEIQLASKNRKIYKEGRLVHRTEQELKTHTSYLVFGILPREWIQSDEECCTASLNSNSA